MIPQTMKRPKASWQPDDLLYQSPKPNAWLQGLRQETAGAGWLRADELGTARARLKC